MTVQTTNRQRPPLSRSRVLAEAVRYVDDNGLATLSMHKLGARLGVKAMSLYKHVASKDDLLDGIVEQLWTEIPIEPVGGDWRAAIRALATALREMVHRHPAAAPLLTSRQTIMERPLWICHALLTVMRRDGVPEPCAVALLRSVLAYGIGFALAELSLPEPVDDEVAQIRQFSQLLSPQAPDDLVRTAMLICSECDMAAQFEIGIDLMIRGLDASIDTAYAATPAATT